MLFKPFTAVPGKLKESMLRSIEAYTDLLGGYFEHFCEM
jgi:hypothetical protein